MFLKVLIETIWQFSPPRMDKILLDHYKKKFQKNSLNFCVSLKKRCVRRTRFGLGNLLLDSLESYVLQSQLELEKD